VAPRSHPGSSPIQPASPFNTKQTPFLLPSALEKFGGQLVVPSQSNIAVFWELKTKMILSGVALKTNGGFGFARRRPARLGSPETSASPATRRS
jgi:hypothetical protein